MQQTTPLPSLLSLVPRIFFSVAGVLSTASKCCGIPHVLLAFPLPTQPAAHTHGVITAALHNEALSIPRMPPPHCGAGMRKVPQQHSIDMFPGACLEPEHCFLKRQRKARETMADTAGNWRFSALGPGKWSAKRMCAHAHTASALCPVGWCPHCKPHNGKLAPC